MPTERVPCGRCDGDGWVTHAMSKQECPACHGERYKEVEISSTRCSRCGGDGTIIHAMTTQTCPRCGGSGRG